MVSAAAIDHGPLDDDSGLGWHPGSWSVTPFLRPGSTPPRVATSHVPRPRLVQALSEAGRPPVAALVAPAGYGKTSLLVEWSERDERPFAWVALDARDNDPRRLLASTRCAIAAAGGGDPDTPLVLVLDDVHVLHHRPAVTALAAIARDLPPTATLAIASRTQPPLPIARMRAQRCVTELGPRELAMTRGEAAALMRAEHRDVGRAEVDLLLARTEGWPAALSLASLCLAERGTAAAVRFGGADRIVAQYLRDEVLADLTTEQRDFLLRTSVADILTAPLCDVLAGQEGAAARLADLAHRGLLVPLSRADERYRHHRLLADALRAELHTMAPRRERELHRLAFAWHRGAGRVDLAIAHAIGAGDVVAAGDLVWANLAPLVAAGRTSTAERWLARFPPEDIAEHPALALTAAGCALLRGQGQMAAHWTAAAAAADGRDPAVQAGVAALRGALAGSPLPAPPAAEAQPAAAAGRALSRLTAGSALHVAGDAGGAAQALEDGARSAAVSAPAVQALCLAELAVLAIDEDDWELAAVRISRARSQIDRHGLGDHAALALVFAVSALVRAHRGRVEAAGCDLREAARLQAQLVDFPSAAEAGAALLLARAALRLSDVNLAREQLAHARRLLRTLPGAVTLHRWAAEMTVRLEAFDATDGAAVPAITAAELRILQYLPTHLSFREIGELTCVSANTVKTQAKAVYRKLGVSCRSNAVVRARACGLLDGGRQTGPASV